MADAHWKVGTITVPAAAGSVAVTGLGGQPKAVIFYGTNWLTEDSAVTSSGTGLFRGMAAPQFDVQSTIKQNSASVIPAGDAHKMQNSAIAQLNTGGGTTDLFVATLASFDTDGFTCSFSNPESGGYKVVYIALMDVTNSGGYVGDDTSIALAWKPGASLLHGAWAGPVISGSDRTQEFYGGAAYPGSVNTGWYGAGLTAFTFPTSAGQQYNIGIYNQGPHIVVCQGGTFIGPFLSPGNVLATLSGVGNQNLDVTWTPNDEGMIIAWDDEASQTGRVTPPTSQGQQTTVSGLPFSPGLLLGYSIGDESQGLGTGGRGAVGFSVVTPDFQWAALVDGVSSRGAFQSYQRGFVDAVSGTSVHAGTIQLTGDGFVMTTEEDDISPASWVWHAFGHPEAGEWIPQIYRWVMPT